MRARDHEGGMPDSMMPGAGMELPPGATFEPDPQASLHPHHEGKHAP
jgi:hypothetical protein